MTMTTWNGEERRINRISKEDLELIVEGVTNALDGHYCRFASIKTEDMNDVIPFMLSFKGITEKTGMLVWKIIIGGLMLGVMGLTALGFWHRWSGGK